MVAKVMGRGGGGSGQSDGHGGGGSGQSDGTSWRLVLRLISSKE